MVYEIVDAHYQCLFNILNLLTKKICSLENKEIQADVGFQTLFIFNYRKLLSYELGYNMSLSHSVKMLADLIFSLTSTPNDTPETPKPCRIHLYNKMHHKSNINRTMYKVPHSKPNIIFNEPNIEFPLPSMGQCTKSKVISRSKRHIMNNSYDASTNKSEQARYYRKACNTRLFPYGQLEYNINKLF